MTRHLRFVQRFFLFATPLLATSVFATSPSQAASLALSGGEFNLTSFTINPDVTATVNNANTLLIANGGKVNAQNNTNTNFLLDPPEAFSSSLSQAFGENQNYFGLANTDTKVLGNFFVNADELFSVDFTADFYLETSIDDSSENANSSADISFLLFDTTDIAKQGLLDNFFSSLLSEKATNIKQTPLDFFSLTANVDSRSDNDFITSNKSEYVTLINQDIQSSFGGKAEFATASFTGSLKRSFVNSTNLTLIEVKKNQARVSIPEPQTSTAVLMGCGLVGVATKARFKTTTLT